MDNLIVAFRKKLMLTVEVFETRKIISKKICFCWEACIYGKKAKGNFTRIPATVS